MLGYSLALQMLLAMWPSPGILWVPRVNAQTILLQTDLGLLSGLALASVRRSERPLFPVPWGKNGYFLACSVREELSLSSIF